MGLLLTCLHLEHMGALCGSNSKSEGLPSYCPLPCAQRHHQNSVCPVFSGLCILSRITPLLLKFQPPHYFPQYVPSHSMLSEDVCICYVVLAPPNPSVYPVNPITRNTVPLSFFTLTFGFSKANPSQSTFKRKRKSSLLHDRCDCAREPSKAKPEYTTIQEEWSLQCPIPSTLGSAQGFQEQEVCRFSG